jgi:hypothetical protein
MMQHSHAESLVIQTALRTGRSAETETKLRLLEEMEAEEGYTATLSGWQ